eukprot:Phypoly_transcript_15918.p1 GENE.Phypoly_transcript_15918~~Phypoly_transcript_15918.p1  ORF type:complete len:115 (-),score=41.90 Phypoly_transcript_15918:358-702(-)
MHLIDWNTGVEIKIEKEEEKKEIKINKKQAELISKEEWKEYKGKVEEKIKGDTILREQEEKLNKRERLTEEEVEKGMDRIEEILNETIREVYKKNDNRKRKRKKRKKKRQEKKK